MDSDAGMYQLVNRPSITGPEFLKALMERTGNGDKISIRALALAAGVSHSTIHKLLDGRKDELPHASADRTARKLGVDLLSLWAPTGRSTPSSSARQSEAVSA